jgi:hypothetical protein
MPGQIGELQSLVPALPLTHRPSTRRKRGHQSMHYDSSHLIVGAGLAARLNGRRTEARDAFLEAALEGAAEEERRGALWARRGLRGVKAGS